MLNERSNEDLLADCSCRIESQSKTMEDTLLYQDIFQILQNRLGNSGEFISPRGLSDKQKLRSFQEAPHILSLSIPS